MSGLVVKRGTPTPATANAAVAPSEGRSLAWGMEAGVVVTAVFFVPPARVAGLLEALMLAIGECVEDHGAQWLGGETRIDGGPPAAIDPCAGRR